MKYEIRASKSVNNPCYQLQLNFARRFSGWNPHFMVEVGAHASYTNIAYEHKFTVTQQKQGMDPVAQEIANKGNFQMLAAGVYYSLYFGTRHEPAKRKKWFSDQSKTKKKQ
jgi:hypothetical protein